MVVVVVMVVVVMGAAIALKGGGVGVRCWGGGARVRLVWRRFGIGEVGEAKWKRRKMGSER